MIQIVNSLLILYSWILAAILIFFLFLIGRFYEVKLSKRSHYQLFLIPLILFLVAAGWYAVFVHSESGTEVFGIAGVLGPDLLYLIGGLFLSVLCYSLYRTMMGGRR